MSFFNKIFNKKEETSSPLDLSLIRTDLHSHLLPGIDDGVASYEESIEIISQLKFLGYEKIITTPHIMADFFKNTPAIINEKLETLKKKLAEKNIQITIVAAAEYLVDDGLSDIINKHELLTFGDNQVLIELSFMNPPPNFNNIVFDLQISGYKVVLAHPERYLYWMNDFEKFEDLKSRGVHLQMNLASLSGYYSPQVKKLAEKMIDYDLIDIVGTDIHSMKYIPEFKIAQHNPYLEKLLFSGRLINHSL